jgi:branched-chain amino acid transport system substrate-binding protein
VRVTKNERVLWPAVLAVRSEFTPVLSSAMRTYARASTRAPMVRQCALLVIIALAALTWANVAAAPAGATDSSERVVTIGVIAPIDAGLTSFGQGIRDSVQLAVLQANAARAIPGWTIKVRALDDSSDPAKGVRAAKKLAADPTVVAVVGPYNSGVAEKILPVLAAKGIALVSPSNTLTSLTLGADPAKPQRPYANYFRLVGPDSLQAVFLANQARSLGYATAAVASETKAVSKGLADEFVAAFAAAGGTTSVRTTVPDNATAAQFADFVTAAKQAAPDFVFFGGEYNVAGTLRAATYAAGLSVPLLGGDGMNDPAYLTAAGQMADRSFASGVGVPIETLAGADEFLAAYRAAGFTVDPTDYGPYAYDAANAVVASLAPALSGKKALPSDVRAKVVAGLQATMSAGLTGQIAFDGYGDTRDPQFTLYRVEGSPAAWVAMPAT